MRGGRRGGRGSDKRGEGRELVMNGHGAEGRGQGKSREVKGGGGRGYLGILNHKSSEVVI